LLAINQIGGPLLVLIGVGAAWWLFMQDRQVCGGFMTLWGVFVSERNGDLANNGKLKRKEYEPGTRAVARRVRQ